MSRESLEKLVGVTWLPSLESRAAVTLGEASGLSLMRNLLKSYWKASGLSLWGICYLSPVFCAGSCLSGMSPVPPRVRGHWAISRRDRGSPPRVAATPPVLAPMLISLFTKLQSFVIFQYPLLCA